MMQGKPSFTKRNLFMTLGFCAVFVLLFLGMERLFFSETLYNSTWNRIRETGSVPDVLIMGNSHAYCSFVPDILNGALGVDSAVLAASGQDAYGTADTFETVLQTGAPSLVILEINAFISEPGIMAQNHKSFALSNINGMPGLSRRALVAARELGVENIPQGSFQLLRADLMWSRWSELLSPKALNRYEGQDVLGYQFLNWYAGGDYDSRKVVVEEAASGEAPASMLDQAAQAELRRFLSMAQAHGVEVWLVKTPVANTVVTYPTPMDEAAAIARDYGETVTFCRDFTRDLPSLQMTSGDFFDKGHLNRRGAARFTRWFAEIFGERRGTEPHWENAFAYADEQILQVSDEGYQYTMEAMGERVLYRFELEGGGEMQLIQDWSENNTVLAQLPPDQAERMRVSICPASRFEQKDAEALSLAFMAPNRHVLRIQ